MSDEIEQAKRIANRWLDEPNADPDDDERVLARQFMRAREALERRERWCGFCNTWHTKPCGWVPNGKTVAQMADEEEIKF